MYRLRPLIAGHYRSSRSEDNHRSAGGDRAASWRLCNQSRERERPAENPALALGALMHVPRPQSFTYPR